MILFKKHFSILLWLCVFCVSIHLTAQDNSGKAVEKWKMFEVSFAGPASGNAYKEVWLTAEFSKENQTVKVNGFYDGDGVYKIRFMPQETGVWNYRTLSNHKLLTKKTGSFTCTTPSADNHGPVKVWNTYNFQYADGKPYYPFGTTAYAWTHMANGVQEMTLASLKKAGFNKIRMCVFPKNYDLVKEEPEIYPYVVKETVKDAEGKEKKVWDFTQFNPAFFQHLEKRITDLGKLGIEADLILFHPYDKGRWGFDEMPMEANIFYIKYLTSRLAPFSNVWWSLANEYDYVKSKTAADWETLSKAVVAEDPYKHLCSIHGSTAKYIEYWKPEYTHVSIQDEAPVMHPGAASILRNAYYKPIIYDEVGYEGNLRNRWGRYSGEEMNHLIWQGVIAGTYVTHGESYLFKDNRDTIFWAKGGIFKGESWKRVGFLKKIIEEGPGPIEFSDISRDFQTASGGPGHYLIYLGKEANETWLFNLPAKNAFFEKPQKGERYKAEIIDTWNMTITPVMDTFRLGEVNDYRLYDETLKKIRLPMRPYLAIRLSKVP